MEQEEIEPVTPKEVTNQIKTISLRKAPDYDLINGKIFKKLPRKDLVKLISL